MLHVEVFSHFYNPTLGINLEKREITLDGMLVSVNIWDTAGQEKFLALTKNYFRKADGVLVIFDLTDKNSFDSSFNLTQRSSSFGCTRSTTRHPRTPRR